MKTPCQMTSLNLRMSKSLLIYADPRYGKRTYATAMQLTFGNCAGIMAPL